MKRYITYFPWWKAPMEERAICNDGSDEVLNIIRNTIQEIDPSASISISEGIIKFRYKYPVSDGFSQIPLWMTSEESVYLGYWFGLRNEQVRDLSPTFVTDRSSFYKFSTIVPYQEQE